MIHFFFLTFPYSSPSHFLLYSTFGSVSSYVLPFPVNQLYFSCLFTFELLVNFISIILPFMPSVALISQSFISSVTLLLSLSFYNFPLFGIRPSFVRFPFSFSLPFLPTFHSTLLLLIALRLYTFILNFLLHYFVRFEMRNVE